jgi:hypothetical protein
MAGGGNVRLNLDGRVMRALDAVLSAHPAQEGDAAHAFA